MAIINTYPTATPKGADLLIGTQVKDDNITENSTKSFSVDAIKSFIAGSDIVNTVVTITSEQLGDLSGTDSIELIEAPGSNKIIVPVSIICFLDYATEAYNFSANLEITTKTSPLGALPTAQLNASGDTYFAVDLFAAGITFEDNQSLNLFANSTTVSTGDSPLKINIAYRIVDFS